MKKNDHFILLALSRRDGSSGDGAFFKLDNLSSVPQAGEGRELTPGSCALTSTLWRACTKVNS